MFVAPSDALAPSCDQYSDFDLQPSGTLVCLTPSPLLSGLTNIFASLGCSFSAVAPEHLEEVPTDATLVICEAELYQARRNELEALEVPVVVFATDSDTDDSHAVVLSAAAPTPEVLGVLQSFLEIDHPLTQQPSLSPREREILALAGMGKSNPEIAAECYVSTATVKTHLLRTYRKLGVADRAAAVYRALKLGLIT